MIQPVTWHGAPLLWTRSQWAHVVLWAPHGPMHPACDPRNEPPPGGWYGAFAAQNEQENKTAC